MRKIRLSILLAFATTVAVGAQSQFDAGQQTWTLTNSWIQAVFQLTPEGYFRTRSLTDGNTGDAWMASASQPSSPIHMTTAGDVFDANRPFTLINQYSESIVPSGVRQHIVLQDLAGAAQITVILEMYDDQPVVRS